MSIQDRLAKIESVVSFDDDPVVRSRIDFMDGRYCEVRVSDLPAGFELLSTDQQGKTLSILLHFIGQSWSRLGVPEDDSRAAAQMFADAEWAGLEAPIDIEVTDETVARIDGIIQAALDVFNDQYAATAVHFGNKPPGWMDAGPDADPAYGPRAMGKYARVKRQTIEAGQPWYGA